MTLLYLAIGIVVVLGGGVLHAYLTDPPTPQPLTEQHIVEALRRGDRLSAMRWYVTLHHVDAQAAAEGVDRMARELQLKGSDS